MARYKNKITIIKQENGTPYYSTAIPSDTVEEQLVYQQTARLGDRWDTLAHKYLGNAALWHVIANANNSLNGSIFIKPGTIVTIPQIY